MNSDYDDDIADGGIADDVEPLFARAQKADFVDGQKAIGFNYRCFYLASLVASVSLCFGAIFGLSNYRLLLPIQRPEWPDSTITVTNSLTLFGVGGGIFGGPVTDKLGVRWSGVLGSMMAVMGIALSGVGVMFDIRVLLIIGLGPLVGIGVSFTYVAKVRMIFRWQPRNAGKFLGVMGLFTGVGALLLLLGNHLLSTVGSTPQQPVRVDLALYIEAAIVAVLFVPLFLIARLPTEQPPRMSFSSKTSPVEASPWLVMKDPRLYFTWFITFFSLLPGFGAISVLATWLDEMSGMSVEQVTYMSAGALGFYSIGRLFWPTATDVKKTPGSYVGDPRWIELRAMISAYIIMLVLQMIVVAVIVVLNHFNENWIARAVLLGAMLFAFGGNHSSYSKFAKILFKDSQQSVAVGLLLFAYAVAGLVGPNIVDAVPTSQDFFFVYLSCDLICLVLLIIFRWYSKRTFVKAYKMTSVIS
eukprot:TRINITY_DN22354_c0_g1_i1.p1 TRINITY_DN22354_c0_g1~~TRINITY_DN22354_c0_g1_i1.p1  ORF type:complete len:471 (+),score=194.39 TRINITY_DN22354_c0_g1_i1:57-1469(+)